MSKISNKKYQFVLNKVSGMTNAEAYLNSHSPTNTSRAYLDEKSSKLLKEPEVNKLYNRLLDESREELKKKALITREEILLSLKKCLKYAVGETTEEFFKEEILVSEIDGQKQESKNSVSTKRKGMNLKEVSKIVDTINKMMGYEEPDKTTNNEVVIFKGEEDLDE